MGIPRWTILLGVGEAAGRASILRRVAWCVQHTIGDSVGWWSVRNSQGALSRSFDVKETTELEGVAIDQRGVSCEVAILHSWVLVMVKTHDSK